MYSALCLIVQIVSEQPLRSFPELWLPPLEEAWGVVRRRAAWYSGLRDLLHRLSAYPVQADKAHYLLGGHLLQGLPQSLASSPDADEAMKSHLDSVLNATLNTPTQEHCLQDERGMNVRLVLQGAYVLLSDVPRALLGCPGATELWVFAANTVFVDADLALHNTVHSLAVVAPNWHVLGHRLVDLDGPDGGGWPWRQRSPGERGRAGLPGGSAASFLGVGRHFHGGSNLRVAARGGRGGRGEDGMQGTAGWQGGGHGGRGGDGGQGGLGGNAGVVRVVSVAGGHSDVHVEAHKGGRGPPGAGGPGGRAVQAHRRRKRELITFLIIGAIAAAGAGGIYAATRSRAAPPPPPPPRSVYYSGSRGSDGASRDWLESPESYYYDWEPVLPAYRRYVDLYRRDAAQGRVVQQFLDDLAPYNLSNQ